MKFQLFG